MTTSKLSLDSKDNTFKDLLLKIEDSAIRAAKIIISKLENREELNFWRKADDTVVTEADIEAEAFLVDALKGNLPIVGEEDPESYKLLETQKNYIVIDPLDGTTSARRFGAALGGQVGYGPIVGIVLEARLVASVYVNIPLRKGFLAVLDHGCESFSLDSPKTERTLLPKITERSIDKSAMLFYAGKNGELAALSKLRQNSSIENYYRFGGFANDSIRVALDFEQLQLQFSVKAWDLPAVLIPHEVGCKVVIDPLGEAVDLKAYHPKLENPLLLGQPSLVEKVLSIIRI